MTCYRSQQGFGTIVSLLESEEAEELGLRDEGDLCAKQRLNFIHIPIPDRGTPGSQNRTLQSIASLRENWLSGESVVLHCRMAYGRAPMIAACLMVSSDCTVDQSFARISRARGVTVPETPEQISWVREHVR
jgi:protein-tyrosine phosphatase